MMELRIDQSLVDDCRRLARRIADRVEEDTRPLTTVSVERTILRLLGLEGADEDGVPLPNRVVDALGDRLADGVAGLVGGVMAVRECDLQEAAGQILDQGAAALPRRRPERWKEPLDRLARAGLDRLAQIRDRRRELTARLPVGESPWFYVIVATGNIYEDAVQAEAAARQGAQVIAVIRSTAQSLLDYVPEGATTEGFAGTFATRENFRIMRETLDRTGEELGRYVMLCNYCSGLCMPEIAALGALERLDMMLNDAMYGIIFRDINPRRTLTDQFFSRRINGFAGIMINTGEDNYLKTDDGLKAAHTVLASQFINLELAQAAGVPPGQIGLGHAFELDPRIEDGFIWELAQALLSRVIFPEQPLKYMPPTRYKGGDIFMGYLQDGLFNVVSQLTGQQVQLLGMLSEAVHTPGVHDRHLALRNAAYVRRNLGRLGEELQVRPGGRMERRAKEVLRACHRQLEKIAGASLFDAIEAGTFAGIARRRDGGKGLDGVAARSPNYYNPFDPLWEK